MQGLHIGSKHVICLGKPKKYYTPFFKNIFNFFLKIHTWSISIHFVINKTLAQALNDEQML